MQYTTVLTNPQRDYLLKYLIQKLSHTLVWLGIRHILLQTLMNYKTYILKRIPESSQNLHQITVLAWFPLIQKVSRASYKLKIPSTWKSIHPVVNKFYLTSYVTPTFKQQSQKSDNRIINPIGQEKIQEVEEILDSRWRENKLQYLIKWREQPLEERTWKDREVVKRPPKC